MSRFVRYLLLFASICLTAYLPPTAGRAEGGQPAMLILPGSAWMKQIRFDGALRLDAAKSTVIDVVNGLDPQLRLGLLSYGHRRRFDCEDLELLRKPEPLDADQFSAAVSSIAGHKNGLRPVVKAITMAAQALRYKKRRGTIILISDGQQYCPKRAPRQVCALVKKLSDDAADLKVHVVGLALSRTDQARVKCIADITGGEFIIVRKKDELRATLNRLLAPLAAHSGGEASTAIEGRPGLLLSAALEEGGKPLRKNLAWRIEKLDAGAGNRQLIFEGRTPRPALALDPGTYKVTVRLGFASATETVDVGGADPTPLRLLVQAGRLQFTAFTRQGEPTTRDVSYAIYRKGDASGRPLTVGHAGRQQIYLPSGAYRLVVQQGLVTKQQQFRLPVGGQAKLDILLFSGGLSLSAVAVAGGEPLQDVEFFIYESDPGSLSGRRELARSAASRPRFDLPAGTYFVAAHYGEARATGQVTIHAGKLTNVELRLASARVKLISRLGDQAGPLKGRLSYTIERLEENGRKYVASSSRDEPIFNLPAGRYRITGRYGPVNARAVAQVSLRPGEARTITLEHRAGTASLRLTRKAGGIPLAEVFWEAIDRRGVPVWDGGLATPRLPLLAGEYRIIAEHRGKRYERDLRVAAGKVVDLEITIE